MEFYVYVYEFHLKDGINQVSSVTKKCQTLLGMLVMNMNKIPGFEGTHWYLKNV